MALTITDMQQQTEEFIKKAFNVDNAELLKTGELGFLVNFFTNIKWDSKQYYQTLFNENNPALAERYESLFFHADYADYNFTYSIPSILNAIIVLQKYNIELNEEIVFTIPAGKEVEDFNGNMWTIEKTIIIKMVSSGIQPPNNTVQVSINAWQIEADNVVQLNVNETQNPTNPDDTIYIVDIPNNFKQYSTTKSFHETIDYEIGGSFTISEQLPDITKLYKLEVYKVDKDNIVKDATGVDRTPTEQLKFIDHIMGLTDFELNKSNIVIPLKTYFNRYNIGTNEDACVLKITTNTSTLEMGNGIYGKKLNMGDIIIVKIKETNGKFGNVNTNEFQILTGEDNVGLKGMSLLGSKNGKSLDNVEQFRKQLVNHIYSRDSVVTQQDFKHFFKQFHKKEPYILSSQVITGKYIWVYNALFDQDNHIIDTTTKNIQSTALGSTPFMGEYVENGVTFKSPFYHKHNITFNTWDSYLIKPHQQVVLGYDVGGIGDFEIIEQMVLCNIEYNYDTKKSYVELSNVQNKTLTYTFSCDQFNDMELNLANGFKQEIPNTPSILHAQYCFIEKTQPMTGIVIRNNIHTIDATKTMIELKSKEKIYQDYFIQTHPTTIVDSIEYVLKIGVISKAKWNTLNKRWLYDTLFQFFQTNLLDNTSVFDLQMIQVFSNTQTIHDKYQRLIFNQTDSPIISPKLNLLLLCDIDEFNFSGSKFKSTSEWKIDCKINIMRWFEEHVEGHHSTFREDELETYVKNIYPFLNNVRLSNQLLYKLKNENESQQEMLKMISNQQLEKKEIIEFVPSYFHIDNIDIKW